MVTALKLGKLLLTKKGLDILLTIDLPQGQYHIFIRPEGKSGFKDGVFELLLEWDDFKEIQDQEV